MLYRLTYGCKTRNEYKRACQRPLPPTMTPSVGTTSIRRLHTTSDRNCEYPPALAPARASRVFERAQFPSHDLN